jgi:hypothetical protein
MAGAAKVVGRIGGGIVATSVVVALSSMLAMFGPPPQPGNEGGWAAMCVYVSIGLFPIGLFVLAVGLCLGQRRAVDSLWPRGIGAALVLACSVWLLCRIWIPQAKKWLEVAAIGGGIAGLLVRKR